MTRPLLLIVGVQKSGTTLLSRLCQEHGVASNPFKTEGNDFFGNEPPFAPRGDPAGVIYQAHAGAHGHAIDAAEARDEHRALLSRRLADLPQGAGAVLNKNPYNSVRVAWLRAMFADAVIVAMVREPVANAYSLAKKYIPHDDRGLPPDEGFWGVKPAGWRTLVQDDKLRQSAEQWDAVNRGLLTQRTALDRLIAYHDLCARPAEVLADLERRLGLAPRPRALDALPCFDAEYAQGSRLRSKNRYFRETGSLIVPPDEEVEFPALTQARVDELRACTSATWQALLDATR